MQLSSKCNYNKNMLLKKYTGMAVVLPLRRYSNVEVVRNQIRYGSCPDHGSAKLGLGSNLNVSPKRIFKDCAAI